MEGATVIWNAIVKLDGVNRYKYLEDHFKLQFDTKMKECVIEKLSEKIIHDKLKIYEVVFIEICDIQIE